MIRTALIVLLITTTQADAESITGKVILLDGDTVTFSRADAPDQTVRLFGIDTPERAQRCLSGSGEQYACGSKATKFLAGLIGAQFGSRSLSKRDITCHFVPGQTSYGRKIGVCYLDTINLNLELVRAGWAVAYRRYLDLVQELKPMFLDAELKARRDGCGIWQGQFIYPWRWRKGQRLKGQ